MNTRDCADDSVITTVRSIETIGVAQYQQYYKEVIKSGEKSIHDSIKKNSLAAIVVGSRKGIKKTLIAKFWAEAVGKKCTTAAPSNILHCMKELWKIGHVNRI